MVAVRVATAMTTTTRTAQTLLATVNGLQTKTTKITVLQQYTKCCGKENDSNRRSNDNKTNYNDY